MYGVTMVKLNRLFTVTIGFMTLSMVNGMVVRIALMCSNVVIFPMLWLIKTLTGQRMTNGQRAQIYHSMGIIGAEAAHLERNGMSKGGLIWSLVLTLFIFYFM